MSNYFQCFAENENLSLHQETSKDIKSMQEIRHFMATKLDKNMVILRKCIPTNNLL